MKKSILFRSLFPLIFAAAACTGGSHNYDLPEDSIPGFTSEHSAVQLQLENDYDSFLSADEIRDRLQIMSAKPTQIGSTHNRWNAFYQDSLFKSWGLDSKIEEYEVLYPTPKEMLLQLTTPQRYTAALTEPPIPGDPSTFITEEVLPGYTAYGGDGDVTAELVYVNLGLPEDYAELERRGISVEGKIVIVRYGGAFRGVKPKLAQEHGAVGCIIFSDPDYSDDPYPIGSAQPLAGIQRGSVLDIMVRAGDPLTPYAGATKDAERIPLEEAETIWKIPVLPISAKEAEPFMRSLDGQVAPRSWQGNFPFAYHIGAGAAKARLKVINNWEQKTLYNVIATIEGSEFPDQWIIWGSHRDGWVFGASDPLSSNVAITEAGKSLAELLKTGWKPKRTIKLASWDGEEAGLIGSTEWVEHYADELREKAILYINSDGTARGFLNAGGSHSLNAFVNETGKSVTDPQTGVDIIERLRARLMTAGNERAFTHDDIIISPIGSGSDFGPFLDHLGMSTLSLGFGGEGGGGSYHSAYDTFANYIHVNDSTVFNYGVTLAEMGGRSILRMANADLLPFRFVPMAEQVTVYLDQIKRMYNSMLDEEKKARIIKESDALLLASDPTKPKMTAPVHEPIPALDFSPLEQAVERLKRAAESYDASFSAQMRGDIALSKEKLDHLNTHLQSIDQYLITQDGLPGRPWYRHHVYATGRYTGYSVKTLPGVREGIEERKWDEAISEITATARTLNNYAEQVEKAVQMIK